jgi:threonylcarbamoyladenosine tRNA methylthiotransferase MtaB
VDRLMEETPLTQLNQSTPSSRYQFTIHTYGCKVNTYDSGLLQKRFQSAGLTYISNKDIRDLEKNESRSKSSRVHILNTCAVTAEATREAVKAVRRIKSKEPFSTVVVTGCAAQVDGGILDDLPGADLIVANSHKGMLENLIDQHFNGTLQSKVHRSNIFRKEELETGGGVEADHTRAFLKIQDGCNSFCTYCVIPFARGKSRSIAVASLIDRVRELRASGIAEIVLTGVHIGDYEDEKSGLSELVQSVLEQTDVPRLRLSSLEPVELTPRLLKLYENPRLCPHFHMSIQSANTRVLSAMRRHYGADAVEEALNSIQSFVPGAFVGMDVIAGFPGETEEEFADTFERLARLPWTRLHVFPYSERPGTKAVLLPDPLSREIRVQRAARLRELSNERFASLARSQVGKSKRCLVLKFNGQRIDTLSSDYWPVRVELGAEISPEKMHWWTAQRGKEVELEVTSFDDSELSRMDGVLMGAVTHG